MSICARLAGLALRRDSCAGPSLSRTALPDNGRLLQVWPNTPPA